MDLINNDEPCLVMLRTLEGKSIASLLGKGFLGDIHGELKTFGLHGKFVEFFQGLIDGRASFSRVLLCHPGLDTVHTLATNLTEANRSALSIFPHPNS